MKTTPKKQRPTMRGAVPFMGGTARYVITHPGPRRLGVQAMWSTPGRALRVPVNAVLDFGVDLNLTEFLGAELPSNVVEGIAAILRPVLERMGSRPAQPKRGA